MFDPETDKMRAEMDRIERWFALRANKAHMALARAKGPKASPARALFWLVVWVLFCTVLGTWLVGGF